MKKIFFPILFLISFAGAHATELHIENVIVNFPCLVTKPDTIFPAKGDTISVATVIYQCTSDKQSFQLQITKEKKSYDDYIKEFTKKNHATITQNETKVVNHTDIKYLVASYTKNGIDYVAESYLYVNDENVFFMTAIRNKEVIARTAEQIFLNSLIIINH